MLEHLQKLVSQGFMMATELMTCHMPENPMSPAPVERYVVSFMAFYERGFGVPSHRFLYSLLQHYCLELHNLTPLGILHIAAFVTLCEAYMGIDPYFDQWNYFFCVRRPQDPNAGLTISGGGRGYPRHDKAGHQSLFQHLDAQINERMAEAMVLPEERCQHTAPYVHQQPPHSPA
jgi:hypothetical protein